MVSGYSTSTSFLRVDGWSTDPRVLGRHITYDEESKTILAREVKQCVLATPRYGKSNLGARIDNESIVLATLQFRY